MVPRGGLWWIDTLFVIEALEGGGRYLPLSPYGGHSPSTARGHPRLCYLLCVNLNCPSQAPVLDASQLFWEAVDPLGSGIGLRVLVTEGGPLKVGSSPLSGWLTLPPGLPSCD